MRSRALLIPIAIAALVLLPALTAAGPGDPAGGYGSNGVVGLSGDTRVLDAATQADGKLVVVGDAGNDAGQTRMLVARFTATGRPDGSFHGGSPYLGAVGTTAREVAIQADGKIVVAGKTTDPSGTTSGGMLVLRLTRAGAPDGSFSGNGMAEALGAQEGQALGVAIQADGKIVASGAARLPGAGSDGYERMAAARFRSNGSLDGGFGQGGTVLIPVVKISFANAVAVQPNGRIVLAGSHRDNLQSTELFVTRLNANGSVDGSFDGDGYFIRQFSEGAAFSAAYGVEMAPGNKIVLGGTATSASIGGAALAVRLNAGGGLDGGFGGDGSVLVPASSDGDQYLRNPLPGARAMVLSGGDVILSGHFDDLGIVKAAVWALRPNGALDSRFGEGGRTIYSMTGQSRFDALAAAPDGSLLAGGSVTTFLGAPSGILAKLGGFPIRGPKCLGKASTIVGTGARNVLRGTGRRDVIVGLGGPDRIISLGGNDLACGGAGNDRIALGSGKDSGSGGGGKDLINGGVGRDRLLGNAGVDTLIGGGGNDRLIGGGGLDNLNGGPGRNNVSQ